MIFLLVESLGLTSGCVVRWLLWHCSPRR